MNICSLYNEWFFEIEFGIYNLNVNVQRGKKYDRANMY